MEQIHWSGFVWSVCHRLLALVGACFHQLNHLSALGISEKWRTGRLSALVCVWWCGVNWSLVVTVFVVDSLIGLMSRALEWVVCLEILSFLFKLLLARLVWHPMKPCAAEPQESVNKDRICIFGWTVPLIIIHWITRTLFSETKLAAVVVDLVKNKTSCKICSSWDYESSIRIFFFNCFHVPIYLFLDVID